jgi:two-component system chemotaxis sensor kinase CheA
MRAYQREGNVVVEVQDDGAGIDPERVRQSAVAKGVLDPAKAERMGARELQHLIFLPGFSTLAEASSFGGRGVGMDVVQTNVERLGGNVEVESEVGVGTIVSLRLPLTLAIMPSLVVEAEGRRFAIPQVALEEIVRVRGDEVGARVERIDRYEVLRLREVLLPLVRLSSVLGLTPTFEDPQRREPVPDRRARWSDRRGPRDQPAETPAQAAVRERRRSVADRRQSLRNALRVAVLRLGSRRYGLVVDDVLDNEEIVVKPLPALLSSAACYGGTAIMGDGSVAMILEPGGIAQSAGLRFDEIDETARARAVKPAETHEVAEQEMLVFSTGGPERLAVPLAAISRIDKRRVEEIESVGDTDMVRTSGAPMRLLRLEDYLPIAKPASRADVVFIIVPKRAPSPMGFRAAQIGDTVRTRLDVDSGGVRGRGIRGTATIAGHIAVVLDMPELVDAASGRTASGEGAGA